MKRVRTQKLRIRRDHPWHEVLPAGPRDPDVLRAKALARAQRVAPMRRMRELTDLSQAGGLSRGAVQ
jgi:hypothetical protein